MESNFEIKSRCTLTMQFAWDEKKAAINLSKHGISFEEAATVFGDPLSDTFDDPDHSLEERRFVIIGTSEKGRMLVVAHTDEDKVIRIISAREPTSGERKFYEENGI
ncbi:MAG TPA: BrnT family toxin [Pyrinomonadaceae bacterium]|nr:BrnT family toxin [Pyrinomonadaceae bacterium]